MLFNTTSSSANVLSTARNYGSRLSTRRDNASDTHDKTGGRAGRRYSDALQFVPNRKIGVSNKDANRRGTAP